MFLKVHKSWSTTTLKYTIVTGLFIESPQVCFSDLFSSVRYSFLFEGHKCYIPLFSIPEEKLKNTRGKFTITSDALVELLPNGNLTIVCDLEMGEDHLSGAASRIRTNLEDEKKRDEETLFKSELFSDCKIVCDEREFKCHRNVLASRSQVFLAMFNCDMKEASCHTVEIKDLTSKSVGEMLQYMYTGKIETEQPEELLKAAHKYMLDALVKWCVFELWKKITTANVVQILILARTYSIQNLEKAAIQHIAKNWCQIREREDWKALTVSSPDILDEIVQD